MDILNEDLCVYFYVSKGNHCAGKSRGNALDLYLGGPCLDLSWDTGYPD
jgi:hypothetical protein